MMNRVPFVLVLVGLLQGLALSASANSWLVFTPAHTGDAPAQTRQVLLDAVDAGLRAGAGDARVLRAEREAAFREVADCEEPGCVQRATASGQFGWGVLVRLVADPVIFETRVRIIDPRSGDVVAEAEDACPFCTDTEAAEQAREVVVRAMRAAGPPPAPRVIDIVVPPTPTVETPAPAPAPTPAEEVVYEQEEGVPWTTGGHTLRIATRPESATITVNGQEVGRGGVVARVAEQSLEIRVSAEGFRPHTREIRVDGRAGNASYYFINLSADVDPADVALARQVRSERRERSLGVVGPTMVGVGAAALAGGIIMLSLDGETTCNSGGVRDCREVYETTLPGIALTSIGALSMGAGSILWMWGRPASGERGAAAGSASTFELDPIHRRVFWRRSF